MKAFEQHLASTPVRRWRVLLVLGVLAGLLAMHALSPVGAVHEHAGSQSPSAQHMGAVSVSASDDCAGEGGHCGGGHLQHADPTCVAAAVSGAPALPALVPDPVAVPVRADAARSYGAEAPDCARAPPSLAELQLLRI
ncbi:DUF6153 family protein [Streptomyces sp. NPDC006872]|uniref:DUF6153 family protein n=1 Tax=Streptomyces sp. NPDC006872 TaxID=3155720 RepID=UPI0033FFB3EC